MADIPAGAQRSPDGNYWWDENSQAWQLIEGGGAAGQPAAAAQPAASDSGAAGAVAAGTPAAGATPDAGADAAAGAAVPRTGSSEIELGVVAEDTHSHDDVVAMVESGGAQLPQHEGAGEAYA